MTVSKNTRAMTDVPGGSVNAPHKMLRFHRKNGIVQTRAMASTASVQLQREMWREILTIRRLTLCFGSRLLLDWFRRIFPVFLRRWRSYFFCWRDAIVLPSVSHTQAREVDRVDRITQSSSNKPPLPLYSRAADASPLLRSHTRLWRQHRPLWKRT